jgi:hypothetical protein
MSATRFRTMALLLLAAIATAAGRASAQALARRVAAVGRGTVDLEFAARPGVCGDGRSNFRMGRSMHVGDGGFGDDRDGSLTCVPGPVRARLRVSEGEVTDVRVFVGPRRRTDPPDADLGSVPSSEAADFMLRIAETGSGRAADGAITAAVLADSVSVWRRLLAIARDSASRSRSTRQNARFWVGRFAAAKISGSGEDLAAVGDDGDHDDPRNAAVFALSQLRNGEGVPALLQAARTHRDPVIRRQALFWLGESGDPRGVALFAEILGR